MTSVSFGRKKMDGGTIFVFFQTMSTIYDANKSTKVRLKIKLSNYLYQKGV